MNTAIILAGGTGQRMGMDLPKQFALVNQKPVLAYTLDVFQRHNLIDRIILVCIKEYIYLAREICDKYNFDKVNDVLPGGYDFMHSCINGVNHLENKGDEIVVISSADRPFITEKEITDSINVCKKYGSGVAARKCSLCMCYTSECNSISSNHYMRESLMQLSTPWTFDLRKLKSALDDFSNKSIICESYPIAAYIAAGNDIYFSYSDPNNFKITHKYDLQTMKSILDEKEIVYD